MSKILVNPFMYVLSKCMADKDAYHYHLSAQVVNTKVNEKREDVTVQSNTNQKQSVISTKIG